MEPAPQTPSTEENYDAGFEEELSREDLLKRIKQTILRLAVMDDADFYDGYVREVLDEAHKHLEELKENYPEERDIVLFEEALIDLEQDFKEEVETELDSSMEAMMEDMKGVIAEAGVEQKDVSEVINEDSLMGDTLCRMEELGVEAEYVVEAADPNAPVIVLFMQVHPAPSEVENIKLDISGNKKMQRALTAKKGVLKTPEESQLAIYENVWSLVEDGVGSTLYAEIVPLVWGELNQERVDVIRDEQEDYGQMASLRLEEDLGDAIDVRAYDIDPLKYETLSGEMDLVYRFAAHNVFIASNLTTRHSGLGEQPVSFATMGGEHERYRNPDVEHQIPISHAMAYYGFNVVVVNQAFN